MNAKTQTCPSFPESLQGEISAREFNLFLGYPDIFVSNITTHFIWNAQNVELNVPYVTEAQVGLVFGQSKQVWLSRTFLSLRNCAFLSAVGMHTAPLPAAVTVPSAFTFPLIFIVWPMNVLDLNRIEVYKDSKIHL